MEPLHVQYSYDDNSVVAVDSTYDAVNGAKVSAKLYNLDAKEKGSREATLDLAPDSSTKAFDLPKIADLTKTYFLRLQLHDAAGKLLSDNFYWLSTKPDVLDWKHKKDTVYTPQAEFGDLTGLNSLPQVQLEVESHNERENENGATRVTVRNPSASIAFMIHLRLTEGQTGEDIVPIFWDDNYFSLLPGESRDVIARYSLAHLAGKEPVLQMDGYNVSGREVTPATHP
jgi:exo-1,4-beta-D-glucosaminidase